MLSSVLRSPRAVEVNIEIMRAFVRLRQLLSAHKELADEKIHAPPQDRGEQRGRPIPQTVQAGDEQIGPHHLAIQVEMAHMPFPEEHRGQNPRPGAMAQRGQ